MIKDQTKKRAEINVASSWKAKFAFLAISNIKKVYGVAEIYFELKSYFSLPIFQLADFLTEAYDMWNVNPTRDQRSVEP